ncbi:MAG: radical SAM protein [Planctomycetes bacterium]|nr:radical SAM protein [Planctomycetota bacterium]
MLRYLPFAARGLAAGGPPIHLTVFVTGACNLRCRHCFHWREVAAGVPGPALGDLRTLADSAAGMGPLLWLSLGGGEPFLRRDLAEVASAFARHGLRHLTIPTNGLLPERAEAFATEVLDRHPDLHLALSVSFDGPPAIHDAIRQVEGGHARAMECVRRLKRLQARLPRLGVGVLVCVTRENQDVLAGHVEDLVRELAPDNVTVNLARGDALDRALLDVDVARYEEVVATKARLGREGALPYFDFPLARVARARDALMYEHVARVARGEHSRRHLPCTAGTLSAVVFENGDVRPCELLPDTLGNLAETGWDLARLWDGQAARALRRKIAATRCACTWECAAADNVLFNARSWPRLAYEAARG